MNFTGKLTTELFLKRYWQRKPLLIPQALPDFVDPLSAEELAGLACEEEVESRLIQTAGKKYILKTGPFTEKDFLSLPAKNWTLLVQAVDEWLPKVKQLLQTVSFLPNWRVDDVMISYATAGGGVGPHFDYYDVFLIQGSGSRIWRTGQSCNSQDESRSESGLKLLNKFETTAEYELHSGDVLYVPPGVAHWSISNDDSLSYSIGFRAPSLSDMLLGYSDYLADTLLPDQRYTDPALKGEPANGEISQAALEQARQLLSSALQDKQAFAQWFGQTMTEPRYPENIQPRKKLPAAFLKASAYCLNPASRIAWHQQDKQIQVFIDGNCTSLPHSNALTILLQRLSVPATSIPATLFQKNATCRQLQEQLLLLGSLQAIQLT